MCVFGLDEGELLLQWIDLMKGKNTRKSAGYIT